ncbi:MAG: helix-turn-helix transcriptional regulator [Clostridia bacterium]|nr:helix-turn-helix transcriptional regulator [Clostridia bacterium]
MDALRKINRMRLERGWSVYRLSVESDVPQSTLINMFNRETQPSIATLEALCKGLGITLAEFFAEDEEEQGKVLSKDELNDLFYRLPRESQKLVYRLMRELSRND